MPATKWASPVTALTGGNYVVGSPDWNGNKGAATWGNGGAGLTGTITAANSLVGSIGGDAFQQILSGLLFGTIGDQVGLDVTALSNGNYVVGSPDWNDNRGAATWGNGSLGVTGTVSTSNSLTGTNGALLILNPITQVLSGPEGDQLGASVTALTDGDYVVGSPNWTGNIGAATWGGAAGITGTVSASNSLVGSNAGDEVGLSVTALTDGDYVVGSPYWNGSKGAATWGGAAGITGTVSASNSLVGSTANDEVGLSVTALTDGDYVVGSPDWSGDKGAATWGGAAGITGAVSASNSLVGSTAGDEVGLSATALADGNYVVGSPHWNGGRGAASWGNGASGITGTISASNALVGSTANDEVGLSVTALTDGNYVVGSPYWSGDLGAATWGNGSLGITGAVSASNSLVGSSAGDEVGLSVSALGGGAYVVVSPDWSGALGAATYGIAGAALTGTIDAANSIEGTVPLTLPQLGIGKLLNEAGYIVSFASAGGGEVVEGMQNPNALTYSQNPSGTVTITPLFLTETLNNGTSVTLQANDDIVVQSPVITVAPLGTGGNLTLQAGRSLILDAGIVTDNGNLTLIANDTAADGVVNADRDAGNAVITMGLGAQLNAGSGTVSIDMKTGAGITNAASGGIVLGTIYAGTIDAIDETGTSITLNGQLGATASGNAIVLSTAIIDNTAGALALQTPNGRYILYSNDPGLDTFDGISGYSEHYGITYAGLPPVDVGGTGNWSYFAITPTLTVDVSNAIRLYGDANPSFTYTPAGLVNGDTAAAALGGAPSLTTSATVTSNVGTYTIAPVGTLTSPLGYDVVVVDGTLTVNQASLTITADNAMKLYGAADPTLAAAYTGLRNGDSTGVVTGLTLATPATSASNVGDYAIVASGAMAQNYSITYGPNGTLDVTPAPLTVVAGNASRLYGAVNPAFSASYQGLVNSDSSAVVTGLSLSTSATTASNVGSYAIAGSGAVAANYTLTYVSGTLAITPASLTITPGNAARLYGSANPAFSASYVGLVNGNNSTVVTGLSLSTSATSAANVGTYAIGASGGTAQNYAITYGANGTLSVTPAPLTITVDNSSRLYGAANPAFSSSYAGLVNGDGSAAVTGLSYTTPATTASNVGTYGVLAGNGAASNYTITYAAGTLSVTPAPLTIVADNASRLYGAVNPALAASYEGLVNADSSTVVTGLSLSTPATTASNVGSYAIAGSGAAAANYAIIYASGTLAVTPAPLTITAENASRLYGAANPAFSAAYTGLVNSDGSSVVSGLSLSTSATTASNAGTYAIAGSGASAQNYAITYMSGVLSITPASLTITVDNSSRLYGAANPAFSSSYAGLVNGDGSAAVTGLSYTTPATTASNVGTYGVLAGSGAASNYTITYVSGTLSITPAPLTIAAENASKLYGAPDPTLGASYTGLVNGDTSAAVSGLALSTTATSTSGVGMYAVTASGGSAQNYTLSYGPNATLTVDPAPLTITSDNASRLYGSANPSFSASYAGLVNGDSSGVVSGLSLSTTATTASNAGTYAIAGTGASAQNYAITYASGMLSVTPAPLEVTAGDASRLYGAADPSVSLTYSGFVNGDSTASLTSAGVSSPGAGAGVGTYPLTPQIVDANYAMTYVPGTLTVTPAPLTITANDASRAYDTANPVFTASFQGLVNGDPSSVVTGLSFTTAATSTSPIGSYSLAVADGMATNYTIGYGPAAVLEVTAPGVVTTPPGSPTPGEPTPGQPATGQPTTNSPSSGSGASGVTAASLVLATPTLQGLETAATEGALQATAQQVTNLPQTVTAAQNQPDSQPCLKQVTDTDTPKAVEDQGCDLPVQFIGF